MNATIKLSTAAFLAVSLFSHQSSAVNTSCMGDQQTDFSAQIKTLPPAQRSYFETQARQFDNAMANVRNQAKPLEQQMKIQELRQLKQMFDGASSTARSEAIETVKRADPNLVEKARTGDKAASAAFTHKVLSKFGENPSVQRQVEVRMFADPAFQKAKSDDQTLQNVAHGVEKLQMLARGSVPLAEAQRELVKKQASDRYVELAANDRDKQAALKRAATDVPALRELFAAAYLADRINKGQADVKSLQSFAGRSQGVFDDAVVGKGIAGFGDVAREVVARDLQARLDGNHAIDNYLPSDPQARRQLMQDRQSPLARSNAEVFGRSMKNKGDTKEIMDSLIKVIPPVPRVVTPEASGPDGEIRNWVKKTGESLKKEIEDVTTRYLLK
jgi:hypothetical protein